MEAIASKASVSKQTLYRWWPTKGSVMMEALFDQAQPGMVAPETGSLRTDLTDFVDGLFDTIGGTTGDMLRGLMAEAQRDEDFALVFRSHFVARRRAALQTVLTRAAERGELSTSLDVDALIDMLFGAIWYRLLSGHLPLDARFHESLMQFFLKAVAVD